MAQITIPFRPFFSGPMRSGQKVMTCRIKKLGEVGDTFEAFGSQFILTHVFRCRLGYVLSDAFEQEGCSSVQELMDIWKSIHPVRGVDADEIVWAHCFRESAK